MDAPDLAPFVGTWVGTWRTWVVPDVLHDESPITAEIRRTESRPISSLRCDSLCVHGFSGAITESGTLA